MQLKTNRRLNISLNCGFVLHMLLFKTFQQNFTHVAMAWWDESAPWRFHHSQHDAIKRKTWNEWRRARKEQTNGANKMCFTLYKFRSQFPLLLIVPLSATVSVVMSTIAQCYHTIYHWYLHLVDCDLFLLSLFSMFGMSQANKTSESGVCPWTRCRRSRHRHRKSIENQPAEQMVWHDVCLPCMLQMYI